MTSDPLSVHTLFVFTAYPITPPGFPERLGLIVAGLRRTLAAQGAKDRELAALVLILWNRLSRLMERVTTIVARHQAGRLRRRRRTAAPASPAAPRQPPPRDRLPHRRGWLTGWVRECVAHGNHLHLLLEDPDTLALIEAAPQLRPLLRPLWRMLRRDPLPEVLRDPEPAKPPTRRRKAVRRQQRKRRPASRPPSPRNGERAGVRGYPQPIGTGLPHPAARPPPKRGA